MLVHFNFNIFSALNYFLSRLFLFSIVLNNQINGKVILPNSITFSLLLHVFRYFELINIHGKLDPLVNVDLRPEKRVKITFTCGSNSEMRPVDVYRTVSELKTKLEGFAGFPASKMRLWYVDQELRDIQVSI